MAGFLLDRYVPAPPEEKEPEPEHLPPEELPKFLDKLFELAEKKLFLTISGNKAEKDGMTLHLSVFPKEFWVAELQKRTKKTIVCQTYCTDKDWHFVIY